MSRLRRRIARRASGEEGFALLVVMGGMLALSLLLMGTLAYVLSSLPVTRANQDATAAVQAAQAGVDDYLARLASCDSYWKTPCAGSVADPALTGWAAVPDPSPTGTGPAQYHITIIRTPDTDAGLIRVLSTGRVKGRTQVKRSLVTDLRKKSFLDYIYYTDKEGSSPLTLSRRFRTRTYQVDPAVTAFGVTGINAARYLGLSAAETARCNAYVYPYPTATSSARSLPTERLQTSTDGGATFSTTTYLNSPANNSSLGNVAKSVPGCEIQFSAVDTINGPLHTNDGMRINGATFTDRNTTTSWLRGAVPDPSVVAQYNGSGPSASGYAPVEGDRVELPPSNANIKDQTDPAKGGQYGCPYTGPTRIVLQGTKMQVTSPLTRTTNPGCGTVTASGVSTQLVDLPRNGVVYVQRSTEACGTHPLGYPVAGDLTAYDCAAGDAFLQGFLSGRLTIATSNDVDVTGDVTYAGGLTGSDSLGLIANEYVQIYHPVKCAVAVPSGFTCPDDQVGDLSGTMSNVTVSAAILSVQQSFTVQNFDKGARLGTLTVNGGIYQAYRGAVGTGGGSPTGTGYAKQYNFDKRLKSLPPPSFLDPAAAPWGAAGYAEVRPPTDPLHPVL